MTAHQITVGRIVHYYARDHAGGDGPLLGPFAAITAGVYADDPMRADLTVCNPFSGATSIRGVPYSEAPAPACWTWQPVQRTQRPDVGAPPRLTHAQVAEVAHEVNRAYQLAIGEPKPSPPWADAPADQRASAVAGIATALAGATPEQQHAAWLAHKIVNGWTYGPVKDAGAKTHPCLVPYAELPVEQRTKDYLYGAVVRTLSTLTTT